MTNINCLPAKEFPALPGEDFRVQYRVSQAGKRTPVKRHPRNDLIMPILDAICQAESIFTFDTFIKQDREVLYKTLRREAAALTKRYGADRVKIPGEEDLLFSILSDEIHLTDDNDEEYNFGQFLIGPEVRGFGRSYLSLKTIPLQPLENLSGGEPHPHVSTGYHPCMGDGWKRAAEAIQEGFLTDFVTLVLSCLDTYNPTAPYLRLEDWLVEFDCCSVGQVYIVATARQTVSATVRTGGGCYRRCYRCDCVLCGECVYTCYDCGETFCESCIYNDYNVPLCSYCKVQRDERDKPADKEEDEPEEEVDSEDPPILGWKGDDTTAAT